MENLDAWSPIEWVKQVWDSQTKVSSAGLEHSFTESELRMLKAKLKLTGKSATAHSLLKAALLRVPLTAKLPHALLDVAVEAFQENTFENRDYLCQMGEPADSLYVVGSGSWTLSSPVVGDSQVELGRYEQGDIISFSEAVLDPRATGGDVAPASVQCVSFFGGRVFSLPKKSFHTLSTFMGTGGGLGKDYETFLSEQVSALAMATEEECAALASEVTHERRLIKMMTTTDDDDEPFGKGVLIVKTGTLRVSLPRPGSTQDYGVVGSEKTTVNFTSGDVVAEADLRALVDSASAMGHGATSTLAEDEGTSYLRLRHCDSDLMPKRMEWVAANEYSFRILQGMDVFKTLTSEQVETILKRGHKFKYAPGELISQHGPSDELGNTRGLKAAFSIVIFGSCTVTRPGVGAGAPPEVLGELSIGEQFGAKNLVDPNAPRETDVTANSTAVVCLMFDAAAFGEHFEAVKHSLARVLAGRRWELENRGKVSMDDLEEIGVLGEGACGRVKLCVHRSSTKPYAVKIMKKRNVLESMQVEMVRNEQSLLSTCSHMFLLKLAAAFQDAKNLYMVLEFIQGGELFTLIQKQDNSILPLEHARFYAASVACAFSYLSFLNIVYRDLKPENTMLTSDGQLKVIDMGFAKMLSGPRTYTFCGTVGYMAPEIFRFQGHNLACDWWSLGVFIFEMLAGADPFVVDDDDVGIGYCVESKIIDYMKTGEGLDFPDGFDSEAADIVRKLLNGSAKDRMGPAGAQAHPFFAPINWMELERGKVPAPFVPSVTSATDMSNFDKVGGEEADEEEDDEIEDEGAFDSASFVPLLQAPNAKHRHVKKDRRKSDEMR